MYYEILEEHIATGALEVFWFKGEPINSMSEWPDFTMVEGSRYLILRRVDEHSVWTGAMGSGHAGWK